MSTYAGDDLFLGALTAVLLLAIGLVGCATPEASRYEQAQNVTVRTVRWGSSSAWASAVIEYDDGTAKVFDRFCQNTMPIWAGERVNLAFHWDNDMERQCYWLDK